MKDLKKDNKNITILPADKGRCTVTINTNDYQQNARESVNANSTYVELKKDPTKKYKDQLKIVKRLLNGDNIAKAQYYLFCHALDSVLRFTEN